VLLHPLLAAVVFVACVLASFLVSATQATSYTAESRVIVGQVDVRSSAVPGYTDANNTLAATYSRFVGTTGHTKLVATALKVPVAKVLALGTIEASPIPQNPIIRVVATSATEREAVELSRAGTNALVALVAQTNDPTSYAKALFTQYSYSAAAQSKAQADVDTAQRALDALVALKGDPAAIAAAEQAVVNARTTLLEATARTESANQVYQESLVGKSNDNQLRVISTATPTGSDQTRKRELGLAAGILLGVFLGAGVAWLVANRRKIKSVRASLKDPPAAPRSAGQSPALPSGSTARPGQIPAERAAPGDPRRSQAGARSTGATGTVTPRG